MNKTGALHHPRGPKAEIKSEKVDYTRTTPPNSFAIVITQRGDYADLARFEYPSGTVGFGILIKNVEIHFDNAEEAATIFSTLNQKISFVYEK